MHRALSYYTAIRQFCLRQCLLDWFFFIIFQRLTFLTQGVLKAVVKTWQADLLNHFTMN